MSNKSVSTSALKAVRLKQKVIHSIEALAEKDNRNFSNMVETMLMEQLKVKGMWK